MQWSNENADWFDALGKPVSEANVRAAHEFLVGEGYHSGNAGLTVMTVAADIRADKPDQAYRGMRALCGSNETMVIRTLAVLTAPQQVASRSGE